MNEELQGIIRQSSFSVIPGDYVYVKTKSAPTSGSHFMVTQDVDETTVVTTTDQLGGLDMIEKNKDTYALIALNVSIPFYSVGFLAAVSAAIAKAGMNILIVSTYSKDYIMVKKDMLYDAQTVLLELGFNTTPAVPA